MQARTINFIFIGLLAALVAVMGYLAWAVQKEGAQCIANPLIYAARTLSEAQGSDFYGEGYFLIPNSPKLHYNRYNQSVEYPNQGSVIVEYKNYSEVLQNVILPP